MKYSVIIALLGATSALSVKNKAPSFNMPTQALATDIAESDWSEEISEGPSDSESSSGESSGRSSSSGSSSGEEEEDLEHHLGRHDLEEEDLEHHFDRHHREEAPEGSEFDMLGLAQKKHKKMRAQINKNSKKIHALKEHMTGFEEFIQQKEKEFAQELLALENHILRKEGEDIELEDDMEERNEEELRSWMIILELSTLRKT